MPSSPQTLKIRNQDRQEDFALKALGDVEAVYKCQRNTLSRRILGNPAPPTKQAVAYVTADELAAIKMLAASVGMSMSLLIRLTMTQLAGGYQKPLEYLDDPRLTYSQPLATPEYPDDL